MIKNILLLLVIFSTGLAFAQDSEDNERVESNVLSIESTTVNVLLKDSCASAVLKKDMPALATFSGLWMIKGMSLRKVSTYPQAKITPAQLALIEKDFKVFCKAKLGHKAKSAAL